MLCEIEASGSFFTTWLTLTLLGFSSQLLMSGSCFYAYYMRPTFSSWQYKSNPKYPPPTMVRDEIIQMVKGLCSATLCPAASLYLARHGYSKGYCGITEEYGWGYLSVTFLLTWILSDFYEFFYHHLGHRFGTFWEQHKHHHVFYNPSPFAVIADEYIDQFARATPLVTLPLLLPINQDMLFAQYVIFFYGYGTYLHLGFELPSIPADHWLLNTSYQHYLHHARSLKNKPYHTGFFFKIWDQLFGTMHPKGVEDSAMCAVQRGERTRELWEKTVKPDYSVLLSASWWLNPPASHAKTKST